MKKFTFLFLAFVCLLGISLPTTSFVMQSGFENTTIRLSTTAEHDVSNLDVEDGGLPPVSNLVYNTTAESAVSGLSIVNLATNHPDAPAQRSIEHINDFDTWDELVDFAVAGNYERTYTNQMLGQLIRSIDMIGHSANGLYFGVGQPKYLADNFQSNLEQVVSLYNSSPDHLLYIKATFKTLDDYLVVEVEYDTDAQKYPVWYLGQRAYIAGPTFYYESSHGGGSGLSAPASKHNPMIGEKMAVLVTGVSYLDEDNSCADSEYVTYDSVYEYNPIDLEWNNRMIHITTNDGIDLGWVPSYVLVPYGALSLTCDIAA